MPIFAIKTFCKVQIIICMVLKQSRFFAACSIFWYITNSYACTSHEVIDISSQWSKVLYPLVESLLESLPSLDNVVWSNEGPVCSEDVGPFPVIHWSSLLRLWLNPHNPFSKLHGPKRKQNEKKKIPLKHSTQHCVSFLMGTSRTFCSSM